MPLKMFGALRTPVDVRVALGDRHDQDGHLASII